MILLKIPATGNLPLPFRDAVIELTRTRRSLWCREVQHCVVFRIARPHNWFER